MEVEVMVFIYQRNNLLNMTILQCGTKFLQSVVVDGQVSWLESRKLQ